MEEFECSFQSHIPNLSGKLTSIIPELVPLAAVGMQGPVASL